MGFGLKGFGLILTTTNIWLQRKQKHTNTWLLIKKFKLNVHINITTNLNSNPLYLYIATACLGIKDKGIMIASASPDIWYNGEACGEHYRVRCIGGTNNGPKHCNDFGEAIVLITDHCPTCTSTINLSRHAFSKIAHLSAGRIKIKYYP